MRLHHAGWSFRGLLAITENAPVLGVYQVTAPNGYSWHGLGNQMQTLDLPLPVRHLDDEATARLDAAFGDSLPDALDALRTASADPGQLIEAITLRLAGVLPWDARNPSGRARARNTGIEGAARAALAHLADPDFGLLWSLAFACPDGVDGAAFIAAARTA